MMVNIDDSFCKIVDKFCSKSLIDESPNSLTNLLLTPLN